MAAVDLDDPRIPEGLRLTLDALGEMDETARRHGVDLLVLLIPTKVSVFAERAREFGAPQLESIERLASNEATLRRRITDALDARGIAWVSALDALRARQREERIYPRSIDGHPDAAGHRVIGEVVASRLGRRDGRVRLLSR
jgi:hypothetical protein